MPYIKHADRVVLDLLIDKIPTRLTAGQLNYVITKILMRREPRGSKHGYDDYNLLMGVLESVKQELYRRVIVPYENKKAQENGDVF